MRNEDFISSVGSVRVLEKKLIGTELIQKIADASSLEEALRIVSGSSDIDFSSLSYAEDFEVALINELKRVYKIAFEITPYKEVVKVLSIKYDYNNLKKVIKANLLGVKTDLYDLVDIDPKYFFNLFKENESKENIPDYIKDAFYGAMKAYDIKNDPQDISIYIDKCLFEHMLKLGKFINNSLVSDYISITIDIYNIKTLIRCLNLKKDVSFINNLILDGGKISHKEITDYYSKPMDYIISKTFYKYIGEELKQGLDFYQTNNDLSMLERLLDNYLIKELKKAKMVSYGPEIIFAYVANKENEIRQLRILLTGIKNDISSEIIKERLRDNYA